MKNFSIESLKKDALTVNELKSIKGGNLDPGDYNCVCNGHDIGSASSPSGCAALCYQCVSNGGCQ